MSWDEVTGGHAATIFFDSQQAPPTDAPVYLIYLLIYHPLK